MLSKKILIIGFLVVLILGGAIVGYQYLSLPKREIKTPEVQPPEEIVQGETQQQEFKYPPRWTKYVKINNLAEIDSLYDKPVLHLNTIAPYEYDERLELINEADETVYVDTCREYLCAVKRGFYSGVRMARNIEIAYFEFPCFYLQFFKKSKDSEVSYLNKFTLKNNWRDLPLREVFSLSQMGMLAKTENDVLNSQIKEVSEIYVEGENLDIVHTVLEDGPGYPFSFRLYILGWGDFNYDGIEDVLLYTDIADAFWGYNDGFFQVISKLNEGAPIIALGPYDIDPENTKKKLREPWPNLCSGE